LTVADKRQIKVPDRFIERVLRAFFGHSECCVETLQDQYPAEIHHENIRAFVV
jgi:hypothetical protein